MSRSKAQKVRKKWEREGARNPELNRLGWNGLNPVAKMTPTLAEKQRKKVSKHKRKWNLTQYEGDDSIFILRQRSFHRAS